MRNITWLMAATALLALSACGKPAADAGADGTKTLTMGPATEELMKTARDQFKIIPASYKEIEGNTATEAQIALGSMLYHDPRLSSSHTISCASCHNIGLGGGDNESTSIGHKWQMGGRNAPTVLNAVFNTAQFWDGRAKDLHEQAGGPLVNPIEMNTTKEHVIEQLASIPGYAAAFTAAFPGTKDGITLPNVQTAIAAFESTLITPNSKFDQYLAGNAQALDVKQKDGLKLFIDKGCSACHNGVNLGGNMYAKFGVVAAPDSKYRPVGDKGREAVTKQVTDEYSFKVPTLRNITLTAPYFHTGSVWDLKEAVRVMGQAQLGAELTEQEVDKITAFLETLKGDQPKVQVPVLPESGPNSKTPER